MLDRGVDQIRVSLQAVRVRVIEPAVALLEYVAVPEAGKEASDLLLYRGLSPRQLLKLIQA